MPGLETFQRHDFVHLPQDWRRWQAKLLSPMDEKAVALWAEQGRPLVVARSEAVDAPGLVRLGLALPGKRRIALLMPAQALRTPRKSPYFLDAAPAASAQWPEAIADLSRLLERHAPHARVFGSLAWQFFGRGGEYGFITPSSDIDLLLRPANMAELWHWIDLLLDFETRFPAPRLDGEIALPDGDFVSWREFSGRPGRILAKGMRHVRLRPFGDIDALFSERAA